MTTKNIVELFLKEFKIKLSIWNILILNRDKNMETLLALEFNLNDCIQVLENLRIEDFSEGPNKDLIFNAADMWVFGKIIKQKEVYIKITMGPINQSVLCISFHFSDYPMSYPFKK